MKIENKLTPVPTGEVASDSRPARAPSSGGAKGAPPGGVDVRVSPLAAQLQAIESTLAGGEVADAGRIAEIKQAISEGRLQINPDAIADRLLKSVEELIRASKR